MLLEARPDFVCVSIDMKNAHNEVSRRSVIKSLEAQPNLKYLAKHVATCLAAHHRLESSGEAWGEAGEGLVQGDPEAGAEFSVSWHEDVRDLDRP